MAFIYAVSDIHGHLDILKDTLKNVDFIDKDNRLILLGDYVDRGDKSCATLYYIKQLWEQYPTQVIPLMGNHELMLLDDLREAHNMEDISHIYQYLSKEECEEIEKRYEGISDSRKKKSLIYETIAVTVKDKHKELLNWLTTLPHFHETSNQIFVHGGIDEEVGEYWNFNVTDDCFTWKYPPTTGKFYKDIVAGHTHTSIIAGDKNFHKIFWDKQSHFFIDGETVVSKQLPLLKYDDVKHIYYGYEKIEQGDSVNLWKEYVIVHEVIVQELRGVASHDYDLNIYLKSSSPIKIVHKNRYFDRVQKMLVTRKEAYVAETGEGEYINFVLKNLLQEEQMGR